MTPALDPKKIAETNPAVDVAKLEKVQQVRELLEAAGIEVKANYRLAPALKRGKNLSAGRIVRLTR
ncbi:MAG: hypothetical protein L0Y72_17455 [Gemmataceae bacterium]|nr:hypothetical protein [Gemmataceae bacterium]